MIVTLVYFVCLSNFLLSSYMHSLSSSWIYYPCCRCNSSKSTSMLFDICAVLLQNDNNYSEQKRENQAVQNYIRSRHIHSNTNSIKKLYYHSISYGEGSSNILVENYTASGRIDDTLKKQMICCLYQVCYLLFTNSIFQTQIFRKVFVQNLSSLS